MVDSEPEQFELTSPDDRDDVLYPSQPSVAGDCMRHLANQLFAGRYIDDEIVNLIRNHCDARDTPPIVQRYLEFRSNGIRPGRMRVNGQKLTKYKTAKRDHYIKLVLSNSSKNADCFPGALTRAKRDVAEALGMTVASVQRRWTDIESEDKRGKGRPAKKISKK